MCCDIRTHRGEHIMDAFSLFVRSFRLRSLSQAGGVVVVLSSCRHSVSSSRVVVSLCRVGCVVLRRCSLSVFFRALSFFEGVWGVRPGYSFSVCQWSS